MSAAQQPWFEASGTVAPRRPRPKAPKRPKETAEAAPQLELRMKPASAAPAPVVEAPLPRRVPIVHQPAPPSEPLRRTFGSWLLDQAKRPGSLGELAKAAKLDRLFPKTGSADDLRRRFGAAGADGDAFEALDDAEREYDRQMG